MPFFSPFSISKHAEMTLKTLPWPILVHLHMKKKRKYGFKKAKNAILTIERPYFNHSNRKISKNKKKNFYDFLCEGGHP